MWWCNRKAAAPWPATDIWSGAWRGWGNTPQGRNTWIPGGSREDRPQERGVIVGHCHRQVCVHSRLQHRQISSTLLWPYTGCLPLPHTGLRVWDHKHQHSDNRPKEKHRDGNKQKWRQTSHFNVLSCLQNVLFRRFNVQMQHGDVQTSREGKEVQVAELWPLLLWGQ